MSTPAPRSAYAVWWHMKSTVSYMTFLDACAEFPGRLPEEIAPIVERLYPLSDDNHLRPLSATALAAEVRPHLQEPSQ